jgi:dGTPase
MTSQKKYDREQSIKDLGKRTESERDYTAILYSHAFRRLKHKTQVFFLTTNDHISTRLDHSLYVASISSVICRNLCAKKPELDPTLAEAIGIGHDVGHPPFGHAGEKALNSLAHDIGGFSHERHSLRIVAKLEKTQNKPPIVGLNLTFGVRDGIEHHSGESKSTELIPGTIVDNDTMPATLEGCIVRLVDKVAYLGRDIEDAIMASLIKESELPGEIQAQIGTKNGEIVDFFVKDIILSSSKEKVALSSHASELMQRMMDYNYKQIYERQDKQIYDQHAKNLLSILWEKCIEYVLLNGDNIAAYSNDPHIIIKVLGDFITKRSNLYFQEERFVNDKQRGMRIVTDFISTLTDRFATDGFYELFVPRPLVFRHAW